MTATLDDPKTDRKRMAQLEKRGYIVLRGTFKYKPNRTYLKGDKTQPKWELRFPTGAVKYVNHIECFGRVQNSGERAEAVPR